MTGLLSNIHCQYYMSGKAIMERTLCEAVILVKLVAKAPIT
jgi:hypothetical protein